MPQSTASSATVREPASIVVPRARETAAILADRVRHRDAQLRRIFVRRRSTKSSTPLMRMLRGGRGGEVRVKLYLSLLWMAVAPPHSVTYPARSWAALIGLADPPTLGARRVNDALAWLYDEDFIDLQATRGVPSIVTVLDESGNGRPYTLPGAKIAQLTERGRPWTRHVYDKVPVELWTNGWLGVLPGPALACFLVLLSTQGSERTDAEGGSWFARSLLEDRYDMSEDTRQRGMRTLQGLGIVRTRSHVLGRTSVDFQRTRNLYALDLERLRRNTAPSS